MAKSFKRAIACLLAVLMVAFSMPFTAMAAAGDYNPDIEVYFYPIYGDALGSYDPVTGSKKGVDPSVGAGSLGDVAFDFVNGTLSATPAKYADYLDYNEIGADELGVFGDEGKDTWTLGEGDFVAAVVVCKNIDKLHAIAGAISYTGLTPAGFDRSLTGSGAKQRNVLTLRALDDEEAEGDWAYSGVSSDIDPYGLDMEMNEIDANGNIFISDAGDDPYSDVSSVGEAGADYFNPTTGELGYYFENEAVLGTYLFQLTGDPISVAAADPDNTIYPGYTGGLYIASKAEGIRNPDDLTTVAGGTHPGAGKMTYFAAEPPVVENFTVTYVDADGATISTEEVAPNGSPANIPALPTSDDAHVTYAWDVNPSGAVITADTTFTQVRTTTEHAWSDWAETTAAVAPSCTEAGATAIESRTCSICNETETRGGEEVAALGHDYVAEVTAPTCTEAGYTTYTCSRCGDSYTEAGDPATGHTPAEAVREHEVGASCTEAGSYESVVYCSVCGAEISRETVTVDALGHDMGEWAETTAAVAPTCTEAGATAIETRACSRCDYTETRGGEEVAALGHDYQPVVTAPTCTERGYTTYTCSRCGDSYVADYVDALGHDLTWAETTAAVAPTCTEAGATAIETATCSRCDYTETRGGEEVAALGHDYQAVVTAPTCTEQGYTTYTCSRCDDSYVADYTDALGHDMGEWQSAGEGVPATCTTDGVDGGEVRYCSRCDYSETRGGEVIPALGHDFVAGEVVAPTCTEAGYTVYNCSRCDATENRDEVPATGHTPAEAVKENVVEASCTEAGSYDSVVYCSVCNAELSREHVTVDALGHDFVAGEVVAPTCTEAGYTVYNCSRCDATENRDEVPATGHTPAEAVRENVVEASCTEAGSYDSVVYCSVCDAELSRETVTVDALGHDMGEWESAGETIQPTCTEPGRDGGEIRRCSRCDYVETRGGEEIPALGHDEVEIPAVPATCTEDGLTAGVKCSRCDEILTAQEVVPALGHDYQLTDHVDATRDAAGYDEYTCSRCGDSYRVDIPALAGILVKAVDYTNGTVAYTKGTECDGGMLYAYGTDYTLTATPAAGYKFAGWKVGNKIVTDKATYSNVAYTDMELIPVFVEDAGEEFTVIFRDKNGNVIRTVQTTGLTADDIPSAPALPGRLFAGWTIDGAAVTEDDILALTASTQVWATYEKDEAAKGYTITAGEEVTITLPSGVENGNIPYNTKATVSAEGATAWKVGETVVAYGDTYSFYVGADVEITPVFDEIEDATPTVTILGFEKLEGKKHSVFATMTLADGYTLKDRGFLVGKTENFVGDVTVDVQPAGVKKSAGVGNKADQFSVIFGVTAGTNMSAKAYIVVQGPNGTEVIYSDVFTFTGV